MLSILAVTAAIIIVQTFGHTPLTRYISLAEAAAKRPVGVKGIAANIAVFKIFDIGLAEVFLMALFADCTGWAGLDAGITFAGTVEKAPIMIILIGPRVSRQLGLQHQGGEADRLTQAGNHAVAEAKGT